MLTTIGKKDKSYPLIKAVDLFCGAGGLTKGLAKAGIDVRLGIDLDPACIYPYEANNDADFLLKPVEDVTAAEIENAWRGAPTRLLAGCAPCQPFSTYSKGKVDSSDKRWHLLMQFARMVEETLPEVVTMENVPRLAHQAIFQDFISRLKKLEFEVFYAVVNCADYGVPQQRHRLVLLASRLGPIELIPPTRKPDHYKTVRQAIGGLHPIEAGEIYLHDILHQSSALSPTNIERIKASRPGGTWRDWDDGLVADCHKKESGKSFPSVYGRMTWDDTSPTITTQFFGFGNGRFGHPDQDRALSLREGAIIQSFPKGYKFAAPGEPLPRKTIGRLIGNAVPVKLGEAIGKSVIKHVALHRPA